MPLYHVQDGDRPMWVVALNYGDAVDKWKRVIAKENDEEVHQVDTPQGVQFVCNDDELICGEGTFESQVKEYLNED